MSAPQDEPIHRLDAEQSVLGGMLLSTAAIADVVEVLKPTDFYRPAHQVIYLAILDLYGAGRPADPITLTEALLESGELLRCGGAPYLHTLISTVPTAANAGFYAEIVAKVAVLRRLTEAGNRIVQLAQAHGHGQIEDVDTGTIAEIVDRATAEIEQVTHQIQSTGPVTINELVEPTMAEIEALADGTGQTTRVPTGIADLDNLLGGGADIGSVTVIAGRPASGKSTLGTNIAVHAATQTGMGALIFSLEMQRTEIMFRIMSALSKVHLQHLRTGQMDDDEWARLARRTGDAMDAPLRISDAPGITPSQILSVGRRIKQRHDLKVIVIDYVQLMTSGKRVESRQVEVSEFSRAAKLIAMELGVAVFLIAQLNRGPEQRADHRPMLSDLRESGSLEQDCDNCILVHRPDTYDPDDRPGEADLILAKSRNGPTGTAEVVFQGHYSRFADMA